MRGVSALLGFSIWLLLLQYVAAQPSQLNSRLSATSNASDTSNDDSLLDNNSTTIWTAGVGQMDATIMINPKEVSIVHFPYINCFIIMFSLEV